MTMQGSRITLLELLDHGSHTSITGPSYDGQGRTLNDSSIQGSRSLQSGGPIAGEGGAEQKKFQLMGEVVEGGVFERKKSQPSTIQGKGSVEVSKTIT